ncbi:Q-cell neuroblast polarisation [Andreprevotia lacus DSM 23236]|jgi:hypothetical protein|uniref:Q-cell neuroblast polarisation n=1 Tax=Andreprevotia lacus DSM 23236 TaxID=1121001 RepID=A0A1W1XRN2_9NEIS|nr:hypothetical protein [Andreprevotia lacus]SMC26512.1 Q-cell neuroblast polarisation [Andreprevotia lacus DSM 23236]
MSALLYLLIVFILGDRLLRAAFPWLLDIPQRQSVFGPAIRLPQWLIRVPAAWLLGALVMNWTTFFACDLTRSMRTGAYMVLALGVVAAGAIVWAERDAWRAWRNKLLAAVQALRSIEGLYLLGALLMSSFIAFYTLMVKDGALFVGSTVWSDFGPHLAMIRSFSFGDNFPPQYPHYPDGTIRYHFLFQFLAATLEALGFRIDWAFNIPSILSLVSLFLLLYVLAVAIVGSRLAGVLTGVLFIFRSSFAFFSFAKDHLNGDLWDALWNVSLHIGKTEHESWGLWAQNVYANQRHFAFSISILVLVLLALLPLLQQRMAASNKATDIGGRIAATFGGLDNWLVGDWRRAITLGVLLGAIGFWNGAVVITTLIVLFVLALACARRLEFLVIAVIAVVMSVLQSKLFIGGGASAVHPTLYFGFLAEFKTWPGITAFNLELLGIFLPLLLVAICGAPRGTRWLALALVSPYVFATFVSLTTDINANHKFIMIGVMLANVYIAALLARFLRSGDGALKALALIFVALLTITGLVDLKTLYNMNKGNVLVPMNDPVVDWIRQNTKPKDVFLTDMSVLHAAQFAGRPIYNGWPYYAWSAGYDTDTRGRWQKQMYSTTSADELRLIARGEHIDYIIVDDANRNSREYPTNELLIGQTFPLVFSSPKDNTRIYKVN